MIRLASGVRLLQIVENLDRGAVDTWLVRMFVASRRRHPGLHWTFYCAMGKPGRLEATVREHGGEVLYHPVSISHPVAFMARLRRIVRQAEYEVMHCHHDFMSGFYLLAAAGLPLRKRIVHVHNADRLLPTPSRWKAALLREPLRQICLRMADQIVGISKHTLRDFVGSSRRRRDDRVLYYGIDTAPFHAAPPSPQAWRAQLGLRADARILLFVGRMDWFKNPCFVVEILKHLVPAEPAAVALFAGTGPLEAEVTRVARELRLEDRVRVLGWRADTVQLMQAADLLVFPRVERRTNGIGREGLGLIVVEAQAAGLPVLTTSGVPDDAIVVRDLVRVLALAEGAPAWAEAAATILRQPRPSAGRCLAEIESSVFSLEAGVDNLIALYSRAFPQVDAAAMNI